MRPRLIYRWRVRHPRRGKLMSRSNTVSAAQAGFVALATSYLLVLCGLFTAGLPITNATVIVADAVIVGAAIGAVLYLNPRLAILPLLGIALSFGIIALFSQGVELKAVRDATLIVAFLMLGISAGDSRRARLAFWTVSALVIVFALCELLFPSVFASYFNVLQFYIMRGELDPRVSEYADTSLFISSVRGQGRFLLPFLGSHRVSSIFIEPVSMGNFGAIAIAWGLSFRYRQWRTWLPIIAVGVGAVILADARFAAMVSVVFVLARMTPIPWMRAAIALAPFVIITMLLVMAALVSGPGDDLPTRLAQSGNSLANLDLPSLFGLVSQRDATLDAGYAYILTAFGLPLSLALWACFIWLPTPGEQSARFKFLLGLYLCALLCVSGTSLFALKTAALAWFLLGCSIASDAASARTALRVAVSRFDQSRLTPALVT